MEWPALEKTCRIGWIVVEIAVVVLFLQVQLPGVGLCGNSKNVCELLNVKGRKIFGLRIEMQCYEISSIHILVEC